MVSLDPRRFADRVGSWLQADGPLNDVVVSCRVRLARNVEGYPFVDRLADAQAAELRDRLRDVLSARRLDGETTWVGMDEASPLLRLLLRERHLVSRDLAPSDPRRSVKPGRAVAFGESETVSVMVNEEDHMRLQGIASGFAPQDALTGVRELDRFLEREVGFAWSERLGYLTSCPTNVGTGLRASVMLHLPALGLARQELEKVFAAAQRTGLAVRGMYGEGSRAAGDFYQISNQVTLGCQEEELIADLEALVPAIVEFERRLRGVLLEEQQTELEDRFRRSYGMLCAARSMATEVALMHLSNVRLGSCLGWIAIPTGTLNQTAIQIQRGHVHALLGDPEAEEPIHPTHRDRLRASFLRRRLGGFKV